jgi:Mor family transcriptional regulator
MRSGFYVIVLSSRADELHQTIIFYEVQIDNYKELCKKYQLLSNSLQLKEK